MKVKKIIMRTLGSIIGLAFILMGILMLFAPIFDTALETVGTISQILIGAIFVYYGATGRSSFVGYFRKRSS
jgi:uncharacterized protein YacL